MIKFKHFFFLFSILFFAFSFYLLASASSQALTAKDVPTPYNTLTKFDSSDRYVQRLSILRSNTTSILRSLDSSSDSEKI